MREMTVSERCNYLVRVAAVIAGVSAADILSPSRRHPLPVCRWMVCESLVRSGCSGNRASALLGMNHATMLYGIRRLSELQLYGWHPEAEIYGEFRRLVAGGEKVLSGPNPEPPQRIVDCHV